MRQHLQSFSARLRNRDGFLGPVLTLISGTAVAHSITAGSLIILARIYAPSDMGVLAMFSSIVYTLSVASCLRFDIAIVLPDNQEKAFELVCLALLSALAISGLSLIAVALIPSNWVGAGGLGPVSRYLWLLPVNLLAVGTFAALQGWFVRQKTYGLLSTARITQSGSAAVIQIGSGLAAPSPLGLIIGFICNSGAAAVLLAARMARARTPSLPSRARLKAAFDEYRDFPRYSVWEALANSAGIQLPILLIGVLAGTSEVGQLSLAMSVVQAPMALFGTATAQVFLAQAPAAAREGRLRNFTIGTLRGLAGTGGPVLLLLGVLAPVLFPLLFGHRWERAGMLVTWMTPWLLLQFLASPVSSVLSITGQLRLAMLLQIAGLAIRLAAVWIGAREFTGAANEAYAVSGAVFYGVYLFVILAVTRHGR